MQNLLSSFSRVPPKSRWVVGVSGGADSLCLLLLLWEHSARSRLRLVAAHVNYRLRGTDSDRDEALVAEFCRKRGIPLRCWRVPGFLGKVVRGKRSLQDMAREIRYGFFQKVARQEKASGVAVAHHLEDQAETVLDRLLRGAGPRGLTGLREFQTLQLRPGSRPLRVWRPLLGFSRRALRDLLKQRGVRWREDASNRTSRYRRNQIRHQVIPFLEKWNPNLVGNLARTGEIASAEDVLLEMLTKGLGPHLELRESRRESRFRADRLQEENLALRRRWVRLVAEGRNPEARGLSFDRIQEALGVLEGSVQGPRNLGYGLLVGRIKSLGFLRDAPEGKRRPPAKTQKSRRL